MAAGALSPRLVEELRTEGFADGLVTFRSLGEILDVVAGPDAAPGPAAALQELRSRYDAVKGRLVSILGANAQVLEPYDYLPTALIRFRSLESILLTVNLPVVAGVTVPETRTTTIKQSVPLVHADETRAAGDVGAGTYVAVLDTGVDFTRAAFGRCTAPAQPSTCKVAYARDYLFQDHARDDNGHGTNVAGIVMAVAPGARILALDVFDEDPLPILGAGASDEAIIAAINDTMRLKAEGTNVVAMNMSLGTSDSFEPEPCTRAPEGGPNPYGPAFLQARAVGILPVVAAGNDGTSREGVSSPACTPGAASVGAVYDSDVGARDWSNCTDARTRPDQPTCFSQRGPNLTLFAPGSLIDAAGIEESGTSQATPHVAGAVAVLAAARPGLSTEQIVTALSGTGPVVAGGGGQHRLDVAAAVAAVRDLESDPPTTTPPDALVGAASPGIGTVEVTVSWSGSDGDGTGIVAYDLMMRTDGPPWRRILLGSPTDTSITLQLPSGHVYRFAVRARDGAGNVGVWARGTDVTLG
jgi:subtilisin family serine protease